MSHFFTAVEIKIPKSEKEVADNGGQTGEIELRHKSPIDSIRNEVTREYLAYENYQNEFEEDIQRFTQNQNDSHPDADSDIKAVNPIEDEFQRNFNRLKVQNVLNPAANFHLWANKSQRIAATKICVPIVPKSTFKKPCKSILLLNTEKKLRSAAKKSESIIIPRLFDPQLDSTISKEHQLNLTIQPMLIKLKRFIVKWRERYILYLIRITALEILFELDKLYSQTTDSNKQKILENLANSIKKSSLALIHCKTRYDSVSTYGAIHKTVSRINNYIKMEKILAANNLAGLNQQFGILGNIRVDYIEKKPKSFTFYERIRNIFSITVNVIGVLANISAILCHLVLHPHLALIFHGIGMITNLDYFSKFYDYARTLYHKKPLTKAEILSLVLLAVLLSIWISLCEFISKIHIKFIEYLFNIVADKLVSNRSIATSSLNTFFGFLEFYQMTKATQFAAEAISGKNESINTLKQILIKKIPQDQSKEELDPSKIEKSELEKWKKEFNKIESVTHAILSKIEKFINLSEQTDHAKEILNLEVKMNLANYLQLLLNDGCNKYNPENLDKKEITHKQVANEDIINKYIKIYELYLTISSPANGNRVIQSTFKPRNDQIDNEPKFKELYDTFKKPTTSPMLFQS